MPGWVISVVILVVVVGVFVGLYFLGKRMQDKQAAQQEQMAAAAQQASILVIDKKKMKVKDAGLPKVVMDQVPKRLRGSKMPIVKAKIGPQVMSLICDEQIFADIPVKREVKVMISGIYITSIKSVRGKAPVQTETTKPSLRSRLLKKQQELQAEVAADKKNKKKK